MNFQFDVKEVDYICGVLAARPWGEVKDLMIKIQTQANDPLIQGMKTTPLPEIPQCPPTQTA